MREYGRNVQAMVQHACTLEDRAERQKIANYLIEVMTQINPQVKAMENYQHKLWDHLFYISDFQLDVDSPYPKPGPEDFEERAKSIPMKYPRRPIQFKHYGKYVETMIKRVLEMGDEPEKQKAFAEVIGNYMKLVYNQWNRDNISDDVIKDDFEMLTNGRLTLEDDSNLDSLTRSQRPTPQGQRRPAYNKPKQGGGQFKKKFNRKRR